MRVAVTDAKGQLTELIRRAEAGEEVVLTGHGHAVVRLVAVKAPIERQARRRLLEEVQISAGTVAEALTVAACRKDEPADRWPRLCDRIGNTGISTPERRSLWTMVRGAHPAGLNLVTAFLNRQRALLPFALCRRRFCEPIWSVPFDYLPHKAAMLSWTAPRLVHPGDRGYNLHRSPARSRPLDGGGSGRG